MTLYSRRSLLAGALMLLAQLAPDLAHAQYSWIDPKGTRVFSDRPPPPGTPPSRILKGPRAASAPAQAGDPPSPAGTAVAQPEAKAPAQPPSLAEQDAAFRQRQARREDDARKAQQAAAQQAARQEQCSMAKQEEMQMTNGMRISQVDAKGERYFLSDEQRARRAQAARRALQDCR
jgi:hypothetical protein